MVLLYPDLRVDYLNIMSKFGFNIYFNDHEYISNERLYIGRCLLKLNNKPYAHKCDSDRNKFK